MTTEQAMTLPIQGDKLLLALDVLFVWMNGEIQERAFSRSKIEESIGRFVRDESNEDDPICNDRFEKAYHEGGIIAIHCFLVYAKGLDLVTFDASTMIGFNSPFCGYYFPPDVVERFHSFFRAIATGELTEADFRE